jgi:hypothetical protein
VQDQGLLEVTWFCVGMFCGTAQYVSVVAAAQHEKPQKSFAVRLSMPLILSGTFLAFSGSILGAENTAINYNASMFAMLCTMACIFVVALARMRFDVSAKKVSSAPLVPWTVAALLLVGCALFFATQIWFISNILIFSENDGSWERSAVFSVGVARIFAGICLLLLIGRLKFHYKSLFWIMSPILAISALSSFWSGGTVVVLFFLAVLMFELSLNVLSSQFMAFIASIGGLRVTKWLTASVLSGAALGLIVLEALAGVVGVGLCLAIVALGAFTPVILRQAIKYD